MTIASDEMQCVAFRLKTTSDTKADTKADTGTNKHTKANTRQKKW